MEASVATIPQEISKEEAKAQFDYWTKKLKLVHTFSFDEVYDFLMERRLQQQRKDDFRTKIVAFEEKLKALPGSFGPDPFPLTHTFADGMYIRQITVPAKTLTVTKIHAQTHPFFLLKGKIAILTERGVERLEAPYSGITKAGTKRIIWHYDEVVLTTVHSTKETDLSKIEAEVIAPNFEALDDQLEAARMSEFLALVDC